MKRLNRIATGAAALILGLPALGALPLWAQPAQPQTSQPRTSAHGHGPRPGFGHGDSDAGVHIYLQPQTEHWPSNYWPDNYQLDGYDGQPDRPTRCAGESGRTYSTRTVECPAGQKAVEGGRRWSTTP
ncbi:hypothetical protein [uncultured Salinisphaera sp.]|jgi:hypothetical protein|uniref:hypothetical protein n=1 Tax=uncultured Salinisphaera sp. TaxID=359372 RepID=UPI0032B104B7